MSTRSTTNFGHGAPDGGTLVAKIYRHPDGYPDGMLPDLGDFFRQVEQETGDPRYGDPAYLAAKWVVWLGRMFSRKYDWRRDGYNEEKTGSLDFLSVGVVTSDPGDIEFTYWLDCSASRGRRPAVWWKPVGGTWKQATPEEMTPGEPAAPFAGSVR